MGAVIEGKGGGFRAWLNKRLPVDQFMADQLTGYYAPKNFNIWYFFGSLALLVFVMQIVTGIFITMHLQAGRSDGVQLGRIPDARSAVRLAAPQPMHATGASAFFIVVYLHMARALLYGSYKAPRELLWVIGMLIYFALMAEAFMGYVLPWGNMSFWGAQVIINIFNTIPGIGPDLVEWIRGDYAIADCDAQPLLLAARDRAAVPHRAADRCCTWSRCARSGSNNPDGIEIKEKLGPDRQAARRHPVPSVLHAQGHRRRGPVPHAVRHRGVLRADFRRPVHEKRRTSSRRTRCRRPSTSRPTWYFTPYYAILRAIPDQRLGALLMALSVLAFVFLPWLDRAKNKSIRYRGLASKLLLGMFFVVFLVLMWLGLQARGTRCTCCWRESAPAVLRVLHPAAVRVQGRRQWPGSRSSDLPCALTTFRHRRARAVVRRGRASRRTRAVTRGWERAADNEVAQPAVAAARRAQFHGVLLGLPFAEVHALLASSARISRSPTSAARQFLVTPGRQVHRLHQDLDAGRPTPRNGSASRRRICRWWRVRAAATGSSISSPRSTPIRPAARPA